MKKIKSKYWLIVYWLLILGFLFYTRLINLSWGLPYPFHPDERNMATAVQSLNCEIRNFKFETRNCFNPHFFAYGQFPLYLGYGIIKVYKGFLGKWTESISFPEAVISLRIISAIASILNVIVIIKIIKIIRKINNFDYFLSFLILTFPPFFIQFSHFGTTESLLMLFYSLIVFLSLKLLNIPESVYDREKFWKLIFWLGFISGLALATKVSSLIFLFLPLIVIFYKTYTIFFRSLFRLLKMFIFQAGGLIGLSLLFGILFSPHNLFSFNEFLSSIRYESDVALGRYVVFYTRQFIGSVPVFFQLEKIFPYALGWPIFLLSVTGYLGISWKDKKINLLRLAFLIYFLPNAFLFTKWARFMAPIFPLMVIFAVLFLQKIKVINIIKIIIIIVTIIPGLAYLSVYQNPDVRFAASEWIYKNVPENSYILSETANVVDLPVMNKSYNSYKNYKYVSFNFYDLDESLNLQEELKYHLSQADYILVPSRRIFANHPKEKYPLLNDYYKRLFSEKLGFVKTAEFSSYPKMQFEILNFKFKIEFPDEAAEETWTVFDHPVIRIYKKAK